MKTKGSTKTVELNDSNFTTSEMTEFVTKIIDDRINYQKLQFLKAWEQNHKMDKSPFSKKITELEQKKGEAYSLLAKTSKNQLSIMMQDTLKLALVG
ncbi:MAG: hypothetical protein AB8B72_03850 [Crocinitomicaceae bacterium]